MLLNRDNRVLQHEHSSQDSCMIAQEACQKDYANHYAVVLASYFLGQPYSRTSSSARSTANERIKRAFDLVVATLLLVAALPLLALAALLVKVTSQGPAFFIQMRPGRGGRHFPCLKLRTMWVASEQALQHSPDLSRQLQTRGKIERDPRVTPIGSVIRKLSIDELPQLINVIRGEMSLVGPRPVLPAQLELYGNAAELLLSVRPGLTGLWQVSGRSNLSFEARIELDKLYVEHRSLWLDVKLLLRTVKVVLTREGAY